jgi:hypothetical protein
MNLLETWPFRAIRGAFAGFSDGLRGEVDTNQKFSDGHRENDPDKKSAAGSFLSDYSGIRGGARVGRVVGTWGGGLATALLAAQFAVGAAFTGGLWPIIAAGIVIVGASLVGGALLGFAGKYIGGALGGVGGAVLGSVVGLYNGLFRRGKYVQQEAPSLPDNGSPRVPVPEVATPELHPEHGQPQPLPSPPVVAEPNSPPPAQGAYAAPQAPASPPGMFARLGNAAALAGSGALAALGVKSAVHAAHSRRRDAAMAQNTPAATPMPAPAARPATPAASYTSATPGRHFRAGKTPEPSSSPKKGGFVERLQHESAASQRGNSR